MVREPEGEFDTAVQAWRYAAEDWLLSDHGAPEELLREDAEYMVAFAEAMVEWPEVTAFTTQGFVRFYVKRKP